MCVVVTTVKVSFNTMKCLKLADWRKGMWGYCLSEDCLFLIGRLEGGDVGGIVFLKTACF